MYKEKKKEEKLEKRNKLLDDEGEKWL